MKIYQVNTISNSDWDKAVKETYGRPYRFQQQEGCRDRGTVGFTVPEPDNEELMNDAIPEVVNSEEMGVKFAAWLARDPNQRLPPGKFNNDWTEMWWERNFYPDLQAVANDLCEKGLLPPGEYVIDVDW